MLLLIAVLILRAWYVEGLVFSCRTMSGSMAETLLGTHRRVVCDDCGHRFVCGSDIQPIVPLACCPNCGYEHNDLKTLPDVPGDGLLINKSIFRLRRPRRWEVVAFRHPQHAGHVQIKRVVGLPGEKVQIRHGDVYINGRIQRKSLSQQRATAVPVHDAGFRATRKPTPPLRWQGAGSNSQWGSCGRDFAHPATENEKTIDWLEYRHWRRLPIMLRGFDEDECEVREQPVTDLSGYNQNISRREEQISRTAELMLSFTLMEASGAGGLFIRASDGSEQFQVRIDPGRGCYSVRQNDKSLIPEEELPHDANNLTIEVSLFDRQFLLAFDGKVVLAWPYCPSQPNPPPSSRPFAVGVQGLRVTIRDLRVYRDVYYTHPVGVRGRWGLDEPVALADDEYFVLGDNSPISDDSRTWPQHPAVPDKLLVGKPLAVHFPVRKINFGWWVIQVPDPARIRYIQ